MKATEIKNYILNHQLDEELKELYVDEHLLEKQYQRYIKADCRAGRENAWHNPRKPCKHHSLQGFIFLFVIV